MAHVTSQHGTPDTAEIDERVVAPGNRGRGLTKGSATGAKVGGEKDIVKRVSETNQCPGEPD